MVQLS